MKFLEYFSFARRLAYLTTSAVLEPRINLIMMNLFVISSLVNNSQWRNARAIFLVCLPLSDRTSYIFSEWLMLRGRMPAKMRYSPFERSFSY